MSEWKPIETAPKDGKYILLYRPTAAPWHMVCEGKWEDQRHHKNPRPYWACPWSIAYKDGDRAHCPTHWMPLPEPPK